MKVKIQNGNRELILSFSEESGAKFVKAIHNCIGNPKSHPSINYEDAKDKIIITAEYLKNSLIIMPKEINP